MGSISVVQSYFVYWARIESAVVAQQALNTTSAGTTKAGPLTSASLQEPDDPRVAGTASKAASEISNGREELPEVRVQVGIQGNRDGPKKGSNKIELPDPMT